MKSLDQLQSTDFDIHLNESFLVCLDGIEPIELQLVSVAGAGSTSRPDVRQPFSLHFLGPVSSQYLLQRIYTLEHMQMGALELFLVPLGPERGRMRYEAILT